MAGRRTSDYAMRKGSGTRKEAEKQLKRWESLWMI